MSIANRFRSPLPNYAEFILSTLPLLLIVGVISVAAYFSVQRHAAESLGTEIMPTFERFRLMVNSGQAEAGFGFMTQAYQKNNSVDQFAEKFPKILPLQENWTVLQEGENRYRICCAHPGARFSPNSTMTYVLEREGDGFRFTGESAMWLD